MSILKIASLVVTPNAYEESKLLAVVPSNGSGDLDFVRASTKTRFNSEGFIEEVPYNLASYSEEFSNAYWIKTLGTTITPNTNLAPNNTLTADTITFTTQFATIRRESIISAGTVTLSIWIKNINGNANLSLRASNLGVIYNQPITITNEWVRYTATFIYDGANQFGFVLQDRNTSGFGSFLIWGAQLVQGSVEKPYLLTTDRLNVSSIDYTGGGCPSILLEPQRTNLNTNYLLSDWSSQLTKTISYGISPDGTQNSIRLLNESGSNQGISKNYTLTSGFKYSFSFYLKKNSGDLSNATGKCYIYPQSPSVSIDFSDSTNEWKKYSVTFTSSTTGAVTFQIRTDRVSEIEVYGVQLEEGSSVTSIIPTQGSAVTRLQDQLIKTGISNLIGQTEGVFFIESAALVTNDVIRAVTLSDGTTSNRIQIRYENSNNSISFVFQSNGGSVTILTRAIVDITQFSKLAIRYSTNEVSIFIDGVKVLTNNTIVLPLNLNKLSFDNGTGTLQFNAKVNSLLLFKSYLSDDEMQLLGTTSYNTYQEMATDLNYVTQ
jgi:hypothetical protein